MPPRLLPSLPGHQSATSSCLYTQATPPYSVQHHSQAAGNADTRHSIRLDCLAHSCRTAHNDGLGSASLTKRYDMRLFKSAPVQTLIIQTWSRFPFPAALRRWIQWTISPKFIVGVVAVVFDSEGRLLLLRHTYKRKHPWGLPGGGMGYGETTEETVLRELGEEAGVRGEVISLLGIRTDRQRRLIDVFYLCRAQSQDFRPNPEVSAYAYFPLDA